MKQQLFFLLTLFFLLPVVAGQTQIPPIRVFDVASQSTIDTLEFINFDTTKVFDNTSVRFGSWGGKELLATSTPTQDTFPGTEFTFLRSANSLFDLSAYPIRTAVKIHFYENDTLKDLCSGILVGNRWVLTAAHCTCDIFNPTDCRDSMLITPAYDLGLPTLGLSSKVIRYYTPTDQIIYNDLALLELEDTLGGILGWMGMAYHREDTFFANKNFHKLSYPFQPVPGNMHDTTPYNGDTMYYSYGRIDVLNDDNLGVNRYAAGGPGGSGSSLVFTDNQYDYWTFGVWYLFSNHRHRRIEPAYFYVFDSLMQADITAGLPLLPHPKELAVKCYPNPVKSVLTIDLGKELLDGSVVVYTGLGERVYEAHFEKQSMLQINVSNWPKQIYFLRGTSSRGVFSKKVVVQ